MRKIALATCSTLRDLTQSDRTLVGPLRALGIEALAVPWDEEANWESFDGVVLRSCWNYHLQPERFREWIAQLANKSVPVWNAAPVLKWNMDKIYLKDLAARGIQIIPTYWVKHLDSSVNLSEILKVQKWPVALIKPRIGASADFVWLTSQELANDDQSRFAEALEQRDLIVQPFIEEIRHGEWSLVFIDGQYSHAALKRPASGKYFVQTNHGGTWGLKRPGNELVKQAEKVIKTALSLTKSAAPFLYARVDGVEIEGRLFLMELELIEPELFLSEAPCAADHLANAIAARVEATSHV